MNIQRVNVVLISTGQARDNFGNTVIVKDFLPSEQFFCPEGWRIDRFTWGEKEAHDRCFELREEIK